MLSLDQAPISSKRIRGKGTNYQQPRKPIQQLRNDIRWLAHTQAKPPSITKVTQISPPVLFACSPRDEVTRRLTRRTKRLENDAYRSTPKRFAIIEAIREKSADERTNPLIGIVGPTEDLTYGAGGAAGLTLRPVRVCG